ncbi:retrovirus-related pol polyprotein LINE-1 [Tanacetum coccineum]
MLGRSTTEAIHLLISIMKKYRERQKDLHMAFLDLEKAYDSISHELIWKTLIEKGTPRRYLRVIRDIPYLFALILDELSRGIQENIPWCMIFADDIVLVAESAEGLNNIIESWREALKDNGLRRRPQSAPVRRVEALLVDGLRRRGRPKLRWEDRVKQDMKGLILSAGMTSDRNV